MKKNTILTALSGALFGALVAPSLSAQLKAGDFLVGIAPVPNLITALGAYDPGTNTLTTLVQGQFIRAVTTARDNQSVLYADGSYVYRLSQSGVRTTVVNLLNTYMLAAASVAIDQNGDVLLAGQSLLPYVPIVIRLTGSSYSTVWGAPGGTGSAHVTIEQDSGAYIVSSPAGTHRVTRSGQATKLSSTNHGPLVFDPETGRFVAVAASGLVILDKNATVVQTLPYSGALSVQIDPIQGTYHVATQSTIDTLDRQGNRLTRRTPNLGQAQITLAQTFGWRRLSGSGSLRRGTGYRLDLRLATAPNQPYFTVMNTSMRPGIQSSRGAGWTHVSPFGPLFGLSAGGTLDFIGMTRNFTGGTDAAGEATLWVGIPLYVPAGTVFHVSSIVVDSTSPFGYRKTNTVSFIVE